MSFADSCEGVTGPLRSQTTPRLDGVPGTTVRQHQTTGSTSPWSRDPEDGNSQGEPHPLLLPSPPPRFLGTVSLSASTASAIQGEPRSSAEQRSTFGAAEMAGLCGAGCRRGYSPWPSLSPSVPQFLPPVKRGNQSTHFIRSL